MSDYVPTNKSDRTIGQRQYHIHVSPGEVGKYVLLPGDPGRVLRIAKHLNNPKEIAFHREYRTWTGTYKGITVSATSTGIGCPSTAIAIEELANVGATHFIRVGSTGALQPDMKIGDIVVSTGTMRLDGTSNYYAHGGFPSISDYFLTKAIFEAALEHQEKRDYALYMGLGASTDAFYGESPELLHMMIGHKLLNVEMESSTLYVLSHMRGLKSGMVCAVSGNLYTGDLVYDHENPGLAQGWDDAIIIALESIYHYENEGYEAFGQRFAAHTKEEDRYYPKW
jgi:uridine phosphorylase